MTSKLRRTSVKIVKVARQLFYQTSVHKTTMNDIAEAANISRRTLYTHFKSKDEIYQQVVEQQVEDILKRLDKVNTSILPPNRKLKLYIFERFNVINNLVASSKYIRYDFIFNPLNVQHLRRTIDHKELDIITSIIRQGKEQHLFNISDPETFSKTLLLMFKSLEQPFVLLNNKQRNYNTLREYVDMLFNGINNKAQA